MTIDFSALSEKAGTGFATCTRTSRGHARHGLNAQPREHATRSRPRSALEMVAKKNFKKTLDRAGGMPHTSRMDTTTTNQTTTAKEATMTSTTAKKIANLVNDTNATEWALSSEKFMYAQDLLEFADLFPRDSSGDWTAQADRNIDKLEDMLAARAENLGIDIHAN